MRFAYTLIGALLATSVAAHAEIEKVAVANDSGFSVYWWPKLPPVEGWHQEREQSFFYGANVLAPDGFTFKDAESVMYATAIYKPRVPEVKSLDMLIAKDRKDFEASASGVSIQEVTSLRTADGQNLRSFTFFPAGQGNWERVSYGEEGDFYLIFTVRSRSLAGYKSAVTAYEKLVADYKK